MRTGCRPQATAFTLAELLIALAILGLIATFTIPKVLSSQQDGRYRAIAKEFAGTMSAAYEAYKHANGQNPGITGADLVSYMNHVRIDTTSASSYDYWQTSTGNVCSAAGYPCIRLHNGALVRYRNVGFGSSDATAAQYFVLDPDGKITDGGSGDTSATAPGKAVVLFLYYNGRVRSFASIDANTMTGGTPNSPCASCDPPWFGWN